jgi:hypothetical protein
MIPVPASTTDVSLTFAVQINEKRTNHAQINYFDRD